MFVVIAQFHTPAGDTAFLLTKKTLSKDTVYRSIEEAESSVKEYIRDFVIDNPEDYLTNYSDIFKGVYRKSDMASWEFTTEQLFLDEKPF